MKIYKIVNNDRENKTALRNILKNTFPYMSKHFLQSLKNDLKKKI